MKVELNEILEAIRTYQFVQECVMDSCETVYSRSYISASIRHSASAELYNLLESKFKDNKDE